eukprot:16435125-Heterocapsa_arctica.AAC.1
MFAGFRSLVLQPDLWLRGEVPVMASDWSLRGVRTELTWLEKNEDGRGPSPGKPREESKPTQ